MTLLRAFFPICLAVFFLVEQPSTVRGGVVLKESADDERAFSVQCKVKVEGNSQTAGIDGKKTSLPLKVSADLRFLERRLPPGGREAESLRSVRNYELAEAEITVADRKTVNRLGAAQRIVVAEGRRDGLRVYSHGSGMTYEGVELLRTPADNLLLVGLLPLEEVKVGSTWKPSDWVMSALAGVEAVSKSELTCKLDKLDDRFAIISFEGNITGAIQGALTKVTLKGQLAYDVTKKHIRQAVVSQTEDRAVGAVSPGMQVSATLTIDRQVSGLSGPLTNQVIGAIPINPEPHQLALWFDASWGARFVFDRNWHVFHQQDGVAVLRLVENGSLIAQCNVSRVPTIRAGEVTPLEEFKRDIQTSLGSSLKEIGQGEQLKTEEGLTLQRVIANGVAREVPMHWIYYLCTAPDGRQTAFAFNVERSLVERLGGRDREIVQSLVFTPTK